MRRPMHQRRLIRYFREDQLGTVTSVPPRNRLRRARPPIEESMADAIAQSKQRLIEKLKETASAKRGLHPRRKKIAALLVYRLEKGKSLEQIEDEAYLNKTQRDFLHAYVIQRKSYQETAVLVRHRRSYISLLCQTTLNKLKGQKPLAHLFGKYEAMTDRQLLYQLWKFKRENQGKRLSNYNYPLYFVSMKRHLYVQVFHEKKPQSFKEVQAELKKLRAKKSFEEICTMLKLTKIQKEILQQAETNTFKPTSYFTRKYKKKGHRIKPYEFYLERTRLIRKLQGWELPHGKEREKLEQLVIQMSDKQRADFRSQLPDRYRFVLDKRVLVRLQWKEPATLDKIGEELGISRKRVHQMQERLLVYAERFVAIGQVKKPKKPEKARGSHRGRIRKYEHTAKEELLNLAKCRGNRTVCRKEDPALLRELELRELDVKAYGPKYVHHNKKPKNAA